MPEFIGERVGKSPFSPAARAGNRIFTGGILPVDWRTGLMPQARPGYVEDPLQLQSEATLSKLKEVLGEAGASLADVARLTQWFAGPEDWPAGSEWSGISITRYMEARAEKFPDGVPASTAVAVRRLPAAGALLAVEAIAAPGEERYVLPPPEQEHRPPFPPGARVGDRVYLSGELPTNWRGNAGSAVHPDARLDDALWYGDPVRKQTDLVLKQLARSARAAGTDLSRAVQATVFLPDARELVGLEEAWKEWFPEIAPARTIVPGTGLACRGCRVEVDLELAMPGSLAPEPVTPEDQPLVPGHAPAAVRSGDLLHVSGQMAVGEDGADPAGLPDPAFPDLGAPAVAQLEIVLERIERICRSAGAGLGDIALLRIFMPDLSEIGGVSHVLEGAFGDRRPAGAAVGVGGLPVSGCRVLVDAVAHLTERN